MKVKQVLLFLLLLLFLASCGRNETIYFYSLDRSQCITVITRGETRYVINGRHDGVPDTNYVKLKMKYTDSDAFEVCWRNEKYEWESVIERSTIIESKLDTTRFKFSTKLPFDEDGIPTAKKFRQENCADYSFELNDFFSRYRDAIIER